MTYCAPMNTAGAPCTMNGLRDVPLTSQPHLLRQHGIPVELLTDYAGRTTDAVKVGTFKRAKGLEFKVVFLPRFHDRPPSAATQDAVALDRRERYVAMTRARDVLWIGQVR